VRRSLAILLSDAGWHLREMEGNMFKRITFFMAFVFFLANALALTGEQKSLSSYLIPIEKKGIETTKDGYIQLRGFAFQPYRLKFSFYIENLPEESGGLLKIEVKGENKPVRFRILALGKDGYYYHQIWEKKVRKNGEVITFNLREGERIYSDAYPYSLVPEKKPDLFLFIENGSKGRFSLRITRLILEER
jgi:hypothetical protein